jgi:hypothetical protein
MQRTAQNNDFLKFALKYNCASLCRSGFFITKKNHSALIFPRIQRTAEKSVKLVILGGGGEEIYMYCTGRTESSYYSLGQHFNQFYRGEQTGGGTRGGERCK